MWIIGKQPRSLENINLETLFVTKPYESPPSLEARSDLWGGPPVECFCYDFGLDRLDLGPPGRGLKRKTQIYSNIVILIFFMYCKLKTQQT
jgi:hypothetical protein